MFKLVGSDGDRTYSWTLSKGRYILGRTRSVNFCVDNTTVSRQHARIEVRDESDHFTVTDLNSRNGTRLNGEEIVDTAQVGRGDVLEFGNVQFEVQSSISFDSSVVLPDALEAQQALIEAKTKISMDEALSSITEEICEKPASMNVISEIARMLVLPEPKAEMLEKALELIASVIPADRMAILVPTENEQGVRFAAAFKSGKADLGTFNLSKTIINEILTKQKAIIIEDIEKEAHLAAQESIIASRLKSAMAVPLINEDDVLGILYVDTNRLNQKYNDDYLKLLATFGHIIAAKLINYQLISEIQEKNIIDAEMIRAASIQQDLLLRTAPEIKHYELYTYLEQSRQVGGDLYDLAELPDGRFVFLVADVCGKGLGAALLMSNILASFRILYDNPEFDLERSISLVSHQFLNHSKGDVFATVFIGILDPKHHRIEYINAGHTMPVRVKRDGTSEFLLSSGTVIGAFDGLTWNTHQLDMEKGDVLFVYSDGIIEAACGEELYSEERMRRVLEKEVEKSSRDIAKSLLDDVDAFKDDVSETDDITILMIKRKMS